MKNFFKKTEISNINYILKYEKMTYNETINMIKKNNIIFNTSIVVKIIKNHKKILISTNILKSLFTEIDEEFIGIQLMPKKNMKYDGESYHFFKGFWVYNFIYKKNIYKITTKYKHLNI